MDYIEWHWRVSDQNPYQADCSSTCVNGDSDAFVTKFNPDGATLAYSTYLGGTGIDKGTGLRLTLPETRLSWDLQAPDFPVSLLISPHAAVGANG